MREAMTLGLTTNGPSPKIWGSCPWHAIKNGTRRGIAFHDDFENVPSLSTTAVTGLYACFADTGGTIVGSATEEFGAVVLTVDADDNQACEIQSSGAAGVLAEFIDKATAQPHEIWFEARFKLSAVVGNCFVGLMEPFTPAGDHITDAGALADKDFIGFSTLEATPTILNWTYKEEGSTVQVPITTVATMAADTYVKVGFHYNPGWSNAQQIAAYLNNAKLTTYITKTNIDAATFPKNVAMALTCAIKNVTDITALTMDWWRVALLELA